MSSADLLAILPLLVLSATALVVMLATTTLSITAVIAPEITGS